jgi:hypothetical protein
LNVEAVEKLFCAPLGVKMARMVPRHAHFGSALIPSPSRQRRLSRRSGTSAYPPHSFV